MTIEFRNRLAIFLWGFASVWLGGLAAMTYVCVRDGPPDGYSAPLTLTVMIVFWIGGIGLGAFALSRPCYRVTIGPDRRIAAVWRYPHKVVRKSVAAANVRPATVIESRDADGDPYFHATAQTRDGDSLDIAEGHSRAACEAACERFNAAVFIEPRKA